MDMDGSNDVIEVLQQEIEREWQHYKLALKEKKHFWELKLIRDKIHEMERTIEKLKEMNQPN